METLRISAIVLLALGYMIWLWIIGSIIVAIAYYRVIMTWSQMDRETAIKNALNDMDVDKDVKGGKRQSQREGTPSTHSHRRMSATRARVQRYAEQNKQMLSTIDIFAKGKIVRNNSIELKQSHNIHNRRASVADPNFSSMASEARAQS